MASSVIYVGLLLLLSQYTTANWMQAPYDDDDDFNIPVEYNDNTTLECKDERINLKNYHPIYWIRPDLTVMLKEDWDEFFTIDGMAGWAVNHNAYEMFLWNMQEEQFGFYYCVLEQYYPDKKLVVIKKAVNYKGAYFGDLWPEYEMNVIIGCSAAGGFIVIAVVLYLTVRYRYVEKAPGDSSQSGSSIEDPEAKDDHEGYTHVNYHSDIQAYGQNEKPPIPNDATENHMYTGLVQHATQAQVYDNHGFESDEKGKKAIEMKEWEASTAAAPAVSATADSAHDEEEPTSSLDKVLEGLEDRSPYEQVEIPGIEPEKELPKDVVIEVTPPGKEDYVTDL